MNAESSHRHTVRRLTGAEIDAVRPQEHAASDALAAAQARMRSTGQWTPLQFMGRRWPIGCVALEITQRCNLDCTACYLSENSESVRDLPLEEVFRRIELIQRHYGGGTAVQVTGGEPTLRKRSELVAIVQRIAESDMVPALFTNGIRAKRDLLEDLTEVGLVDIAFHVDVTQQRRGYASEAALNAVRADYIERARGLPLHVMFNTTVTNATLDQVPDITSFFVAHSDVVRLASFQLQADTGRGSLGERDVALTREAVQHRIERAAGTPISFDAARIGHHRCNRIGVVFVANGRAHDVFDDPELLAGVLEATANRRFDRRHKERVVAGFLAGLAVNPRLWLPTTWWLGRKLRQAWPDLLAARGRVHKLTFFIHNFMDATALEKDRIDACSFMAMTQSGPISMCMMNAKRDQFILAPLRLQGVDGVRLWDPRGGKGRRNRNVEIVYRGKVQRVADRPRAETG